MKVIKLWLLILLNLLSVFTFSQIPNYVPSNGLVAWYPFNGNANDESGNGNNGVNNGATLTTDRNGNTNSAYQYDGYNDYIQYGNYLLNSPSEFTISAWVKFDNTNQFSYIFSQATNGEIQLNCFSGQVSSWNKLTSGGSISIGTAIPDTNQWHHVLVVFDDNNNTLDFYFDQFKYSTTFSSNLASYNGPAVMGRQSNVSAHFFDGKIDDVGIWNRALSSAEILNLYNSACSFSYSLPQDTILSCGADSLMLDAGSGFNTYAWSNGANTQTTSVSSSGMYYITATNSNGCSATDSVYVSLINAEIVQGDTAICVGDSITLSVKENNEYTLWSNQKSICINTLVNYNDATINITVPKEAEMNSDYSDLRFLTQLGTELPYWIEFHNLDSAVVWLKISNILSGTNCFTMYYVNLNANTISNGNNVFELFDAFSDTILNISKWTPKSIVNQNIYYEKSLQRGLCSLWAND